MRLTIAIQIIAKAFLFLFVFSAVIIETDFLNTAPPTYLFYLYALAGTGVYLFLTLFLGNDELVWDLREFGIYDVMLQLFGLTFHFFWYNPTLYAILGNLLLLATMTRLVWFAKSGDKENFIVWPTFGILGWWRQRRGFRPVAMLPTTAQSMQVWVAIVICFGAAWAFNVFHIKLNRFFWAATFVTLILLFYRRFMHYLDVQRLHQLKLEKEAEERHIATQAKNLELQLANDKLNEAITQLADSNAHLYAAKAQAEHGAAVLRDAAHDLQKPVSALSWLLQEYFVETDPELREAQERKLAYFAQTFGEHIDDTIEIAKLETKLLAPKIQRILTADLIRFSFTHLQTTARSCGTWFVARRSGGMDKDFAVLTDTNLFNRIIGNLGTNAIWHAHGRKVLLTLRKRGNLCQVAIRDKGVGIADADGPDHAGNFRRFAAKVKEREAHRTTSSYHHGLGVNNAQVLCARLDALMHLYSREGGGTVFYFFVPLDVDGEPSAQAAVASSLN